MIVCLCRGLSERDLRSFLAAGARSAEDLGDACGAGTDCGACLSTLDRLAAEARSRGHHGRLVPVESCA